MSVSIDAGKLNLRVTIQGRGDDGIWHDKGTRWAGISQQSSGRTTFFFRYQPSLIESGNKLVVNGPTGSTYVVQHVLNAEERNIRLDVICGPPVPPDHPDREAP
jgi:hypothetical protein